MSDQAPNRWLRAFFHPSHAFDQIKPDITFSGGLGYRTRDVIWFPFTVVHVIVAGIYGGVLTLVLGYPLHWVWLIAKLIRERGQQ